MPRWIVISVVLMLTLACNNNSSNSKSNSQQSAMDSTRPPEWTHSTNIYEVNVRQYTPEGTIQAFIKEMPRLKEMGVQVLWFMPLTPIARKNMKGELGSYYAAADYTSISSEFGDAEDFKQLVKEAHAMGFKVIIDWVANHTGWDHVWTKQHPGWYQKDSATNDFKIASGMDDIIELDFSNREMRRGMIDAMKYWVENFDIDGFRADLAFWVELDFWKEARAELDKSKKLFWFGELDPLEHPEYMGTFDAAYTWTWMHKARDFYQKKLPIEVLDSVLQRYEALGNNTMRTWFTTNHDENSWNGTEYEKYGEMAEALAVFSCTWNGIPLIYSGQELPNKKRLEFFKKDTIDWTGKNELHDFYKKLLKLRASNPALRSGDREAVNQKLLTTDTKRVFSFLRKKSRNEVLVFLNLSSDNIEFEIEDPNVNGSYLEIFTETYHDLETNKKLTLKPWAWLVFERSN